MVSCRFAFGQSLAKQPDNFNALNVKKTRTWNVLKFFSDLLGKTLRVWGLLAAELRHFGTATAQQRHLHRRRGASSSLCCFSFSHSCHEYVKQIVQTRRLLCETSGRRLLNFLVEKQQQCKDHEFIARSPTTRFECSQRDDRAFGIVHKCLKTPKHPKHPGMNETFLWKLQKWNLTLELPHHGFLSDIQNHPCHPCQYSVPLVSQSMPMQLTLARGSKQWQTL